MESQQRLCSDSNNNGGELLAPLTVPDFESENLNHNSSGSEWLSLIALYPYIFQLLCPTQLPYQMMSYLEGSSNERWNGCYWG